MPLFSYGEKLTLKTDLTVAELIGKMITYADKEAGDYGFLQGYGPNEIVYNTDGDKFRLWRKPQYLRNGFMPFFYGHFRKSSGQTIITGNFGMHPIPGFVSKLLLGGGISFSVLFLFFYYLVISGQPQTNDNVSFFWYLGPLGMTLLVAGALRFCVWIGEKDVKVITDFIIERFQAIPKSN
jgi:hypothetical protein